MNLADAIRLASAEGQPSTPKPVYRSNMTVVENLSPDSTPEVPQPLPSGSTAVRLEMFLSPEQLQGLFRSVMATQHSVMTLREAAHFLRVHTHVLEELAEANGVPAFQVDGKWRFSRASLDEWLQVQSVTKAEA